MKNYYYLQDMNPYVDELSEIYNHLRKFKSDIDYRRSRYSYIMPFKEVSHIDFGIDPSDVSVCRFIHTTKIAPNLPTHIDSSYEGAFPGCINYPLINCNDNTITRWWKVKSGTPKEIYNMNTWKMSCEDCKMEVIEEVSFKTGEVHLFNVSQWHSVENKTGERRVLFSILFKQDGRTWKDVVRQFF